MFLPAGILRAALRVRRLLEAEQFFGYHRRRRFGGAVGRSRAPFFWDAPIQGAAEDFNGASHGIRRLVPGVAVESRLGGEGWRQWNIWGGEGILRKRRGMMSTQITQISHTNIVVGKLGENVLGIGICSGKILSGKQSSSIFLQSRLMFILHKVQHRSLDSYPSSVSRVNRTFRELGGLETMFYAGWASWVSRGTSAGLWESAGLGGGPLQKGPSSTPCGNLGVPAQRDVPRTGRARGRSQRALFRALVRWPPGTACPHLLEHTAAQLRDLRDLACHSGNFFDYFSDSGWRSGASAVVGLLASW